MEILLLKLGFIRSKHLIKLLLNLCGVEITGIGVSTFIQFSTSVVALKQCDYVCHSIIHRMS